MSPVMMSDDQSRVLITNSTVNMLNASTKSNAWHLLFNRISTGAFDNTDDYEQLKCHPGTRTILLERLEDWVAAPGNAERLLQWLDGPMGSGKTAIARTMADRTAAKGQLIGTFIFSRTASGRNTENLLITTLAYQLGSSIPLVRPFIESQIDENPSILQQSLYAQLESLIFEPLRLMKKRHPYVDVSKGPRLIIVDGLDECGGFNLENGRTTTMHLTLEISKEDRQLKVLEVLSKLVQAQDILPFIVLLHSRPEPHIKGWIQRHPSFSFRITLDGSLSPNDDIRLFVKHNIAWIKENHPNAHLLPSHWPCDIQRYLDRPRHLVNAIDWIVHRSSGQFIYASVAMKFIRSTRHHPAERLLLLFEAPALAPEPFSPQSILDDLYRQVFQAASNPTRARRVLAFHNITESGRYEAPRGKACFVPLSRVEQVLSLSETEMEYALQDLEPLLQFSRYPIVTFHHASVSQFLMDKARAREWYIDYASFAEEFAFASLAHIKDEQSTVVQKSHCRLLPSLLFALETSEKQATARLLWELLETKVVSLSTNMEKNSASKLGVIRALISWNVFSRVMDLPWEQVEARFAALIRPYLSTCVRDPASFSIFLHWVFFLPIGASDLEDVDVALQPRNAKWPNFIRDLFLSVCILSRHPSMLSDIFLIPNEDFLQEALIIMLENSVLSVKSRILRPYPERYGRHLFSFLDTVLGKKGSPRLWHYLHNHSDTNTLKPWFRDLLRKDVYLCMAFSEAQLFSPPNHIVEPCSAFDIALATDISGGFHQWSKVEGIDCAFYQVSIPGIRLIGYLECSLRKSDCSEVEEDFSRHVDESVLRLSAMQSEHSKMYLKKK